MTTALMADKDTAKAAGALHMIRADIDALQFRRWMGSRQIVDDDHAMHCLLRECFGDFYTQEKPDGIAPQPFRLMLPREKRRGSLYGYSPAHADELRETASMLACPLQEKAMPLSSLDSKPMPSEWQAGKRLGFEIRVRPVVRPTKNAGQRACDGHYPRKGKDGSRQTSPHCRPRKECDAFQYEAVKHPNGEMKRSREAVYRDWLQARFENKGGAILDVSSTKLVSFRRTRAIRKLHRRYSEGPDALMRGELEITDGAKFANLLAGGIGRHKAYGYGMLLLRPAASRAR